MISELLGMKKHELVEQFKTFYDGFQGIIIFDIIKF